jgi:uncharacterized Ntn-hydrolase superfamily protein
MADDAGCNVQHAPSSPLVATYSICACDLASGQWGVATQSKFLAVGSVVPWAEPHVGAIATQAYANPRYGPEGLALLREGSKPRDQWLPVDDELRAELDDLLRRVGHSDLATWAGVENLEERVREAGEDSIDPVVLDRLRESA